MCPIEHKHTEACVGLIDFGSPPTVTLPTADVERVLAVLRDIERIHPLVHSELAACIALLKALT